MLCNDCPRMCGVDRTKVKGFCGCGDKIAVAKIIENFMWEEPCISGDKGALAIFFAGCNLRCQFCQNYKISHSEIGNLYSPEEFRKFILSYDLSKFSCIDLITPTHFSSILLDTLKGIDLPIPIVWNSSGYESVEMIKKLSSIVDVFLPDFKYYDESLSLKYSFAKDYFEVASQAILEMRKQKPNNIFEKGMLQEGVLIRHLVLPECKEDSMKILDFVKENIDKPFISLMSQFTPTQASEIKRSLYPLEYKIVMSYAEKLGLTEGYIQEISSSASSFIPDF
ncbi:MAG: 4Fe-4S cluster-binding domain-containing protein [Clostridiales bacterium]|nr:4Fe-4S cluster-binding domain-containing protein [Clostridiales bacterium]